VQTLAAPEELASFLQRDLDAATTDLVLAGASALVRQYCGWALTEQTETITRLGPGIAVLSLPTLLLSAVTEVRVSGQPITPASMTGGAIGYCDYAWTPAGQLIRPAGWPCLQPVAVDCTHGYPQVPDDVRHVVLAVAGRLLSNPERLTWEAVGVTSRTYAGSGALDADTAALLDGYRLP
jgi:hypothetical protein